MINWSEAKILFKYPSRSRPTRFFEGLDSIVNNLSQPQNCVIVCSFDTDDHSMNSEWVNEKIKSYPVQIVVHRGVSKNKIDAINRDLNHLYDSQINVCMSDDMRFRVNGFDDIIRTDFQAHFPNGNGCLHYPDQNQGAACMTMNITDVKYFLQFGYIYHPAYESVECDLENQEVAQMLGRYKFIENRIFDHIHPSFSQVPYDEQYNKTESGAVHDRDKATRRERKKNNYDLIKTESGWTTKPIVKMAEENESTPPQSVTERMDQLAESIKSTTKLREKLMKKAAECKELETEINALGVLKVSVNVVEEAVK